jgi:putative aldouronate transport system permease protein
MKYKTGIGERLFDVSNAAVLLFICFITLYPFLYVVFASLSNASRLMSHTGMLWKPVGFTFEAYRAVFENEAITSGYINTIIYVFFGTAVNMLLTILGAYSLSRKNVYWNKLFMGLILFTMFFGGGLVPTYLLVNSLGMTNTRWAIILPTAISVYNLIIMRTAFAEIPVSLEEAARLDGANDFVILFRIVLPLSLSVLMVIVLYYGVARWNAWFDAMIYLTKKREYYPLQLILREILLQNDSNSMMVGSDSAVDRDQIAATIKYATIMVATLPILLIYPFIQRFFVKGVTVGAVKG